jgi:hypothetical protein
MKFELAEQLKEAGFPQKDFLSEDSDYDCAVSENGSLVYAPRLSELIEACGGRFEFLRQFPDLRWDAQAAEMDGQTFEIKTWNGGIHPTPEEAVATLWLVLHPKP